MKKTLAIGALGWCLVAAASCATEPTRVGAQTTDVPPPETPADPNSWPRVFDEAGERFTIYQPQIESWDGVRLVARSAVSVEQIASPVPHYGTVSFTARTHVEKEQRVVFLDTFTLTRADFPSDPARAGSWLATLRVRFPVYVQTIDLDRLETTLAATRAEEKAASIPLKNDPPRVFFSSTPALLVLIDGEPVLRRQPGTTLRRVINTRSLVLQDEASGKLDLAVGAAGWLEAPALEGPWSLARSVPAGADEARRAAVAEKLVDLHEDDPDIAALLARGEAPRIFVSTQPAELIETHGAPVLEAIPETGLRWVKNTEGFVFLDASGEWFVLLSGRWFRAATLDGPWTFVPGRELPSDFARIPHTHPAGEVLASIPGTPQAREAVVAAGIPQTATVSRSQARAEIVYDGEPRFVPIEGTALRYAVNTRTPVIECRGRFYACEDGIWFVAPSPRGPWVVADSVPPEIYSIPPSSPLHYVTYVHVYDATPGYVLVGYTPGYFGAYAYDGCVVWGTGYYYRPWIGSYWYGYPWTFGFGVGFSWTPFWGWGFGFGFGFSPCCPWWGPFACGHPAFYSHGGWGHHYNVAHANVYHAWPSHAVRTHEVSHGAVAHGGHNNVYSGSDGHLYRNRDGNWERHGASGWQRSSPGRGLESERQARESGAQRSQNASRPTSDRYQPMGPQHGSERTQPRPGSQTVPPGLRGGHSGGGSHFGGGGGHGGGGGGHGGGGHGGHR
ncbi:MAG TPA: hypothetical protein VFF73_09185 [Planctomycetota bacterium]|nr:hypothetical protein [Planctomycetota bacterium]